MLKNFTRFSLILIFLWSCESPSEEKDISAFKVFEKIDSSISGIDFINQVESDINTKNNIFDFDYFYNGAGVATVDINNDNLLDLVFASNQGENKIYLNLGDLKFKDITEGSGINDGKGWSTGISFADINNDGWQDIYVSQGGPYHGELSTNLLFINQQDLTFKEQASEYGLADPSISSQSSFFDYDKDGDLDCIVMNENLLYGTGPDRFYNFMENNEELRHHSSSHLYRNENGKFIDVTEEAGLLSPTFGLGLIVSDINEDNLLDIYIANDYYVPDALYINNGDGTFSNQIKKYTNQVSFFGMGVDIADINQDSYQDIFVLDMASSDHYRSKTLMASMNVDAFNLLVDELNLHHQYMFNSLQLNSGDGYFKNIAHMTKMSKSDWSWSVLLNDFDNSSTNDVFITNGYKKYALNNDVRAKVLMARMKYKNIPLRVKQELYDAMPSEKLPNLLFKNSGSLKFDDVSEDWGISDLSFSNGAAYADLDNDGDLELIVNNIDEEAFLYQNMTIENDAGNYLKVMFPDSVQNFYAKVTVIANDLEQKKESNSVRGYLSSMDKSVHFGLGNADKIDTLRIEWLSGKVEERYAVAVNQEILVSEENATKATLDHNDIAYQFDVSDGYDFNIEFIHSENSYNDFEIETLLPYKQSTLGPFISVADVNNDNLDDFYIGGAIGQSGRLLIQTSDGVFSDVTSDAIKADFLHEDMNSVFLDIDKDGDQDLFVVSGGYEFENEQDAYQDRLYINNGFGLFEKAIDASLSEKRSSGKSVYSFDYDNDGLQDLIVGTRIKPGQYPMSDRSILYKNTGSNLEPVTDDVIPELNDFGMINDIIAVDIDNDSWQDLIVVGEWTQVGIFKNDNGIFKNITEESNLPESYGWWFSITETDVNNDNLPDFVVGNLGLNSKYKASAEEPLKIYASDFDENGTWDIVLSNSYNGNYVPLRGRECSSGQMPFIAQKFPSYDLFAKATLEDVYGDMLDEAYQKQVTDFSSIILINQGNGKFKLGTLPPEAQISPILDAQSVDLNGDGFEDLIAIGTLYNTEVETPRLDMGSGLALISNGSDGYYFDSKINRNLRIDGNLKSIEKITINGENHLILGRNNESPVIVKLNL
ncbi:VCBS repeat-containing protein [Ekhidna sp.]